MNLKKHFHIVWDQRKFGGKRIAISVNRLAYYIGEKRADFIIKKLPDLPSRCRVVYKVQGRGKICVYSV